MANTLPPLSEFGQAAVTLDGDLSQFESLAKELERLTVDSDKGLERAITLMTELNESRKRIELGMRALAKALGETQGRHEQIEAVVCEREAAIQSRQQEAESLMVRFRSLGDMVRQINDKVALLRSKPTANLTPEEQTELFGHMPALDNQMDVLVSEAQKLADEARSARLTFLERNADALKKSLAAAKNRIHLFVKKQISETIQ